MSETRLYFSVQLVDTTGANITQLNTTVTPVNITLLLYSVGSSDYSWGVVQVAETGEFTAWYDAANQAVDATWFLTVFVQTESVQLFTPTIQRQWPVLTPANTKAFDDPNQNQDGLVGGYTGTTHYFTIQLMDQYDEPISPTAPTPTVQVAIGNVQGLAVQSDWNTGLWTGSYSTSVVGVQALTITVNGQPAGSYSVNITNPPPPVAPSKTRIYELPGQTGLHGGPVDVDQLFMLQLNDANGQPVNPPLSEFTVTIQLAKLFNSGIVSYNQTDGTVLAFWNSDFVGEQPLWVYVDSELVETFMINITRALPYFNASRTRAFMGPGQTGLVSATSLQTASFSLQACDQYGDPFPGVNVSEFWVQFWGDFNSVVPTVVPSPGGLFNVSYEMPEYGTLELYLSVNAAYVDTYQVAVAPAVPVINETLVWEAVGQSGLSDFAINGAYQQFSVQLRDLQGRNITFPDNATLSLKLTAGNLSGTVIEQFGGLYIATYPCTVAGPVQVELLINHVVVVNRSLIASPGLVYLPSVNVSLPSVATAATEYPIAFTVIDQFHNVIDPADVTVTFNLTDDTPVVFQVTAHNATTGEWHGRVVFEIATSLTQWTLVFDGNAINSTNVTILHGPQNPRGFRCAGPRNTVVSGYSMFDITVADLYGNTITERANNGTPVVTFTPVAGTPSAQVRPPWATAVAPTARVWYDPTRPGVYRVNYTSTMSGAYSVSVLTPTGDAIAASPYRIDIRPGPIVADQCTAMGYGVATLDGVTNSGPVHSNQVILFNLTSRDIFGNPTDLEDGGIYQAYLQDHMGNEAGKVYLEDNLDGTYLCSYELIQDGNFWILVSYNNVSIANSPFRISTTTSPSATVIPVGALVGGIIGAFVLGILVTALVAVFLFLRGRGRQARPNNEGGFAQLALEKE